MRVFKRTAIMLEASSVDVATTGMCSGIGALVRGSSTRLIASSGLEWTGISLELHDASPVERYESVSADHLISVFVDHPSSGETSLSSGRFVPYIYHPGAINLFPAGPIPACRPFTKTKMIICALDPGLVRDVGEELNSPAVPDFRRTVDLHDQSLKRIVMLLAAEADSGGSSGKLYAEHLAHAMVLRFLWLAGGMRDAKPSQQIALSNRALRRVLDKMRAEVASDHNLNSLAAESGYSKSHFLRVFRAGVGCSPHQWLTQLRIERAKKMLQTESTPLIDIAAACGFSSHAHFSSTFRQLAGVTPSIYRRSRGLIT
jgi:AraC family transcriptional regulator